ncbi:MAG TPA: orotidine-5'-phosphate decarboxylase [Elusimicrobia bacterium]|nr:MAG: orotidine 5'-phosphate decarboxylase [Elusimicrobia bacterium RIFOXYA12_FULL_49_49]OGS09528.1 MAG: orotidine 5'-phosphate decarboxylase [Elusimicrobia bacterium RIFOXYA1_FULL_47_7]OGS10016.1 MAG: orotidine 5'-phosphate decarboxylase [Elusimicrobia bacterium RIFOXYB1_FULL_48_9]OGS15489.1 MAG: orotidine 5'-phosphate decarboxylase [Elusimicrobia bacterium RIFOXYA2_FULL_47_53]OGS26984.1 MAG: orotidine 5'-phosphate decarboxylase [Elusimicrobia bacterium RIFOXYB12_FULL_50_12]OGS30929.1 MAG: 
MKKIIVALDVKTEKQALDLTSDLSPWVDIFKVGPILFIKSGQTLVKEIKKMGKEVFLDLKFHDIPATVQRAVESAAELGVYSLTIHSSGGREMIEAAASVNNRPKIWAVTVLTSQLTDPQEVIKRAKLARESGADGVIASPLEIKAIKEACGYDFTVVTPGIRPAAGNDDQKRIASASVAVGDGADYIVVGRPIIEAKDPRAVAKQMSEEIAAASGTI